ncbi:MAG: acetate--CoA ligase family protein [Thermorudis peleae]|nr:acetate--CoA ligase family protein [Thermorudis peleae]
MARLLEHDAKVLLAARGVPVPTGDAASTPAEAAAIARSLSGPVAVKALVPVGHRAKAGAVRRCADPVDAEKATEALLGQSIGGFTVDQVRVEAWLPATAEYYLAAFFNEVTADVIVLASCSGGIEIEPASASERLARITIPAPFAPLPAFRARELWKQAGAPSALLPTLAGVTQRALAAFFDLDALLLELNPLIVTDQQHVFAAGAVLAVDDAALVRQPGIAERVVHGLPWRPLTPREQAVERLNQEEPYRGSARYLELDGGDIGFLCGGGGASLLLFDALVRAGGKPANYAELGGNPTERKVAGLARVVLEKPGVRGLFVAHNVTNNTQIDVIARGVVAALQATGKLPPAFPVVAREVGLHDGVGRAIFEQAGVRWLGEDVSLDEAAALMVSLLHEAG